MTQNDIASLTAAAAGVIILVLQLLGSTGIWAEGGEVADGIQQGVCPACDCAAAPE